MLILIYVYDITFFSTCLLFEMQFVSVHILSV